ncbi:MAG: thioether cross-link-forming SCIFF peptide maturase, partial [Clostridia bacterium]|nr:thioether cross-link-forming SCIFF peptide maturase [Clostridia bacterium]
MTHQYKLNGYNIVIDTCSGSVHSVDEVAYDIIEMYRSHTREEIISEIMKRWGHLDDVNEEEIIECIEDVAQLEQEGKLFSKDVYEGMAFDFKRTNTVIKALCLHVAHTCNLNCEYCFASQGKYHGERAVMS